MVLRPQRWTIIDDTDDWRVTYGGPWIQEPVATWEGVGTNGPPFLNTLHSIRQNGSVTVNFRGNAFSAYGSVRGYTGPPEGVKVWWNCTVDGVQQSPDPHPTVDENYHRLCYNSALDWRDHTLVIQVTSKDNEPFYFDTVDYSSGINETKTNRRSIVTIADEELFFSPGSWANLGIYKTTNAKGGNLRFPFDGVSVAWYGAFTSGTSRVQSSATWSVDGSPPTEFKLPGPDNQRRTNFFETPKLSPGTHILEVVYNGDHSVAPLTLWQLYIDHGNLPDSFNSTDGPGGETKAADVKMAAVGGGLGAALVLVLGLLIFFVMRYRKRDPSSKADSAELGADARPHAAAYSAVRQDDTDGEPIHETRYAGHVSKVRPTQRDLALQTRAVPPVLPMRTGKGFIQTRHGAVNPDTPPSNPLQPGPSNGGPSFSREEHPPVYDTPARY